jgi:DNA-binding NtrC family response regulator
MQKILVLSDSLESSSEMRRMASTLPYHLVTTYDAESLVDLTENKIFALTILDQALVDEKTIQMIDNLRRAGYAFPILVITSKIHGIHNSRLDLFHDVHVLVRPTHEKNILGLVRKLLASRRVPKQNFRRYNTNQVAQVEALTSGDNLISNMYNLSRGGAYCEFDGINGLAVGEIFRVRVYLTDTKSEYTFNAKVVWTTPKGRFSGRYGCGFKFLTAKDSYREQATE